MVVLAPPAVNGPLLTTSPTVRVDGVLAGSVVTIRSDDGVEHAQETAGVNGSLTLPVRDPFVAGTVVTADQRRGGDSSSPTVHGVPVLDPPDALPRPVFECVLNQCSDAAFCSGLVPGAEVVLSHGSTVVGGAVAERTSQWVPLTAALSAGATLSAVQTLPGLPPSPKGWSVPAVITDIESGVPTPDAVGPLVACQGSIRFTGCIPSAVIEFDDGSSTQWHAVDTSFTGNLWAPLREGTAVLRQRLPACGYVSADVVLDIGPEVAPPAPQPYPYCPESQSIQVDGLQPGATVTFTAYEWNGSPVNPRVIMIAGASAASQSFELPEVVGGAGPLMQIQVTQTGCTLTSPAGAAAEYARPGSGVVPSPPPQIVVPVYSCSPLVVVDPPGLGIGTLRSVRTGRPLADSFTPTGARQLVPLWFPLVAGDQIAVDYAGCGATTPSNTAEVLDVPNPLPDLTIVPPLPTDTELHVSGALPGARVHTVVDGSVRAIRTSIDGTATVPLGLALTEQSRVWAYQALCGSTGNVEGTVPVRKAALSVTLSKPSFTAGVADVLTVSTKRNDTGEEVGGLPVVLNGSSVGVTGTAFSWTAPGSTTSGKVSGGAKYADAAFSVTVTAAPPPPPPGGTALTLQIGALILGVSVADVGWRLEPRWSGGTVQKASGNPATANLAHSSSSDVVSAYLEKITISKNGIALPVDYTVPVTNVGLGAAALHAGFLVTLGSRPVYDGDGVLIGYAEIAVVSFQGVA